MNSPFSLLPKLVPDRTAINVCSTAGIELMSKKRIRLVQLRQGLEASVVEIEKAAKWDEVISRALLTASITKATCEAFLEIAGALGEAAGIKNVGIVAKAGNAAISVADSAASTWHGIKTDWVSTTNKVAGLAGAKFIKNDAMKDLADLQTSKVEILNSAIRGDTPKSLQEFFLGYTAKVGEMSLKYMGRATAANWTSATATVASAGYSYSKSLEEAFNTRIKDREDFSARKSALLSTSYRQMGQIKIQINQIDGILRQCGIAISAGRLA